MLEKEKNQNRKEIRGRYIESRNETRLSTNLLKGAKKEPFCFDANRGPNSDARDVGFSANDLRLESFRRPSSRVFHPRRSAAARFLSPQVIDFSTTTSGCRRSLSPCLPPLSTASRNPSLHRVSALKAGIEPASGNTRHFCPLNHSENLHPT